MNDDKLKQLENQFKQDSALPLAPGNNPVFGEGSSEAPILAIGEAPGFHENELMRPFIGRSGQLLRKLLEEVGIDLSRDIYITNVVKHRPPENRDPTPEEIEAYKPYLDEQIEIISPQIIITLGRFSMNKFLPLAKISAIHGTAHWIHIAGKKVLLLPMYHPAAALRGTVIMNAFKSDFIKLKSALDYFNTMGEVPSDLDDHDFESTNKTSESEKSITKQLPLIS